MDYIHCLQRAIEQLPVLNMSDDAYCVADWSGLQYGVVIILFLFCSPS